MTADDLVQDRAQAQASFAPAPSFTFQAVEYLAARLCHDLVGPVGAIHNGLELIEDSRQEAMTTGEEGPLDEALGLIGHSAEQASRRLRLYRYAFGSAGVNPPDGFESLRVAAEEWLDGSLVRLDWSSEAVPPVLGGKAALGKLILALLLLGAEALPRGGRLRVVGAGNLASGQVIVTADAATVRLAQGMAEALTAPLEQTSHLNPRTVLPYFLRQLARQYGYRLILPPLDAGGGLSGTWPLAVTWPASA